MSTPLINIRNMDRRLITDMKHYLVHTNEVIISNLSEYAVIVNCKVFLTAPASRMPVRQFQPSCLTH